MNEVKKRSKLSLNIHKLTIVVSLFRAKILPNELYGFPKLYDALV